VLYVFVTMDVRKGRKKSLFISKTLMYDLKE